MKLFEDAFTIKGKTYFRTTYSEANNSNKELTLYKSEYYIPDQEGRFRGFLDNIPLKKVQGSAYKVDNAYGEKQGKYVAIREENLSYNLNPRTWYIDIETKVGSTFPDAMEADQEISCIQILDSIENKVYLLSTFEFKYQDDYDVPIEYEYMYFKTELEMLKGYIKLFKELDPFILYAWGGNNFDFPYIYNRFSLFNLEKKLSNYGSVNFKSKKMDNGQIINSLNTNGHYYIDMLDVYKKFVFKNVQDYKLDTIAEIEINQKKVDYSNYNTFRDFYEGNYKITGKESEEQQQTKIYKIRKFLDENEVQEDKKEKALEYIKDKSVSEFLWYAIQDVIILRGIEQKSQFTKLMVNMAQTMGVLLADTLSTLKPWSHYIGNTIYKEQKILPPDTRSEKGEIVGGFVKDPIIGKYDWVFSLDYTSLYPNLMRAYNMSPELFRKIEEFNDPEFTELYQQINHQDENKILELQEDFWEKLAEKEKKYNVTVVFGGGIFDCTKEGFIPELVGGIFKQRKIHKKNMLEYKDLANHAQGEEKQKYLEQVQIEDINQMTMKILINSLYGALGNAMFVLFNETIARSITAMGRWTIILTSNNVQEYIQKLFKTEKEIVIYNDTDSAYINAEPIVNYFKTNRELSHDDIVNLLDNFYKKKVDPVVQGTIDQLARYTNAFQPEVQGADREVIGKAIFVAKKKYTMLVSDNEGVRYTEENPYFKAQGLELIKGGTPDFSKRYLKEAIPVLMNKTEQEIKEWFNQIKQDFMFWELDQISKTQGVSKIYDPNWGKVINNRKVSVPFGSRTAIVSNKYIKENNLTEKFQLIQPGDKVKMLYLQEPNPLNSDAFAFLDKDFAVLFREYIDYDKNFEKFFLAPLEIMTEALGINMKNNTEELDEW